MTVTLTDGIASVSLSGAFIQEFSHEATQEVAETAKMVDGRAQIGHIYPHTDKGKGSVKGRGPLTMNCGVGQTIGVVSGLVSGGLTHVPSVKYTEKLTDTAEWEFSYTHYPHAA